MVEKLHNLGNSPNPRSSVVIGLDDQCIICDTKDTVKSSNNLSGYNTFKKS